MNTNLAKWLVATLVLTNAMCPTLASADTGKPTASPVFADLSLADGDYQTEIPKAAELGLIAGDPNGQFRPTETLTRRELAVLLTKAMHLPLDAATNTSFTDVSADDWGLRAIEAVNRAGVMQGDAKAFRPDDAVTREEMASLVARALKLDASNAEMVLSDREQVSAWAQPAVSTVLGLGLMQGKGDRFAPQEAVLRQEAASTLLRMVSESERVATIDRVEENRVIINGVAYGIADNLQHLFAKSNDSVLQKAKVRFDAAAGKVTKVKYLEIVQNGENAKTGEKEFNRDLVLDAGSDTLDGNIKVAGDFISVYKLTVTGNFEIAKELQNDFYGQDVQVLGQTIINGGSSNTVLFENSKLNSVDVNKRNVRVDSAGTTTVQNMYVYSNTIVDGDQQADIQRVTVKDGADAVELNVSVPELVVSSASNLDLTGTGRVQTLSVQNAGARLNLSSNLKINNVQVPDSVKGSDVIQNYEQAKQNIDNLNGHPLHPTNPSQPTPPFQQNHLPTVTPHAFADQEMTVDDKAVQVDLSTKFADADGDVLTYSATSSVSGVADVAVNGTTLSYHPLNAGETTVTVTAEDGKGGKVSTSFKLNVSSVPAPETNNTPTVKNPVGSVMLKAGGSSYDVDLANEFDDLDHDPLTYDVKFDTPGKATFEINGTTLTFSPVNAGETPVTVTATDSHGKSVEDRFQLLVAQNNDPSIKSAPTTLTATEGDPVITVDLNDTFEDVDGDSLTFKKQTSPNASVADADVAGHTMTVTPKTAGTTTFDVVAEDGRGGQKVVTFTVEVAAVVSNHAPKMKNGIANQSIMIGDTIPPISLQDAFMDEDGDTLTYSVTSVSPNDLATAEINGDDLTLTAVKAGTATVEVTATDGKLSYTIPFQVTVNNPVVTPPAPTSSLIISEADWGDENRLALELYNATGEAINLADVVITYGGQDLPLDGAGMIEPDQSFVIAYDSGYLDLFYGVPVDINYPLGIDTTNLTPINVSLKVNGTVVDSVAWTPHASLVRNSNVHIGSETYQTSQWTDAGNETFDNLGSHTIDPSE